MMSAPFVPTMRSARAVPVFFDDCGLRAGGVSTGVLSTSSVTLAVLLRSPAGGPRRRRTARAMQRPTPRGRLPRGRGAAS
jgi:hypothetical protein